MEFISFAMVEAKMYTQFRSKGTFITNITRDWGNSVVYGGLFLLHDFDFYIRLVDAYNNCSLTTLRKNHKNDMQHRIVQEVVPIKFKNLDELERLKYQEREPLKAHMYVGNPNHPKIDKRTKSFISYRIIDGVDKEYFLQLYKGLGK